MSDKRLGEMEHMTPFMNDPPAAPDSAREREGDAEPCGYGCTADQYAIQCQRHTPKTPDEKRIAEIAERCEKATKELWEYRVDDGRHYVICGWFEIVHETWGTILAQDDETRKANREEREANARFIAAAKQDIPYLLERVRALGEERDAALERAQNAETQVGITMEWKEKAEARIKELLDQIDIGTKQLKASEAELEQTRQKNLDLMFQRNKLREQVQTWEWAVAEKDKKLLKFADDFQYAKEESNTLRAELAAVRGEMESKWISVEERLPEIVREWHDGPHCYGESALVLMFTGHIQLTGFYFKSRTWSEFYGQTVKPTHWMPLPESPVPKLETKEPQ